MSVDVQAAPRALTGRARPSFLGAVAGEILKLRKQLSLWLMLLGGVLLFLLVFLIEVTAPFAKADQPAGFFAQTAMNVYSVLFNTGSGIVLLILSSRLVAMEYSAGTIRVQLGRGVGRLQLLFAKLAALLLFGLALLVGYIVASAGALYVETQVAGRSWSSITSLPHLLTDAGIYLLVALISMVTCILLGTFAATVGRSLAFGIAAALAFFPADNFGPLILFLANRLTNQDVWLKATGYFLGPNLNVLSSHMITDFTSHPAFTAPLVTVSVAQSLLVIGAFCAVFLVGSAVLSRRRDVMQ